MENKNLQGFVGNLDKYLCSGVNSEIQVLLVANRLGDVSAMSFLSRLAVENFELLTLTFFAWQCRFTVQIIENDLFVLFTKSRVGEVF